MTAANARPHLRANAYLIPRLDGFLSDPARSWYFAVHVRSSLVDVLGAAGDEDGARV